MFWLTQTWLSIALTWALKHTALGRFFKVPKMIDHGKPIPTFVPPVTFAQRKKPTEQK
jgi:hypothetical protein